MKLFTTVLLLATGCTVSCSTNSNSTAATNTNNSPVIETRKPIVTTAITTTATRKTNSIRTVQKFQRPANKAIGLVRIVIDKSDFELRVYDSKGLMAVYPVVFGLKPLEDKYMQGDRKTPEGIFKVVYAKQHQRWRKMLMLNYPTTESLIKYKLRKKDGIIPADASIGNGIGIHGVEPGNDYFIDRFYNWTNGCISLKNTHIDDLARYVNAGTPVTIQK